MMRVVMYLGEELAYDIFVRECLYFLRDVVRILCTFLFLIFQLHYPLVHQSCDHLFMTYIVFISHIYIYDDVCCYSPISPCVVSFLSLYTCFFMYVIFYFCFKLRCLNKFCLKCFRKTSCQNLLCHELSSCKVFQEFVLGIDFIVFNK